MVRRTMRVGDAALAGRHTDRVAQSRFVVAEVVEHSHVGVGKEGEKGCNTRLAGRAVAHEDGNVLLSTGVCNVLLGTVACNVLWGTALWGTAASRDGNDADPAGGLSSWRGALFAAAATVQAALERKEVEIGLRTPYEVLVVQP